MLNHSFSEEILPHIQPAPLLAQLEAISPCPVDCYLREEAGLLQHLNVLLVTLPPNLVSFATGLAPNLSPGGTPLVTDQPHLTPLKWNSQDSYKDRINFFGLSYARARQPETLSYTTVL